MKLNDPFRLNDWSIRDFLIVVFAMQLTVLCMAVLTLFGLDVPIAKQVVGFFYLAFIPGTVILRVFRVHNLGRIETLLYTVGLSIAFLMLLGLSMNALYPLIGISKPISSLPLLSTLGAAVFALCALGYARDRAFSDTVLFDTSGIFSPLTIALCLLPLLSVIGAYIMNIRDSNVLLLALLAMVSIVSILAMSRRFPKKLYPLAVFVIALSLLFHNSLISKYISGWDIQSEYYFASLVKANSYWMSSIATDVNSMLSIVMLAPIFSIVSNLSLVLTFKIVYPILFSLVPLGLYEIFRKHIDERSAFLSCFFFVSIFSFYIELTQLARQQIAELFQVLLMLLMIDRSMKKTMKLGFGVIFAFSLVTSHYGLSYIFMFSLVTVWIVLVLRKWQQSHRGIANSNAFVFLYCVLAFTWYIYVSSSSTFVHVIRIGGNIMSNISEFANPNAVEGLSIIAKAATSPLYTVTKILYLAVDLLISVGVLAFLLRRVKLKFEKEYALFSLFNFVLLLGGLTVPYLASSLNTSRLFQMSLLFLAPFCIVGGEFVWNTLTRTLLRSWQSKIDFLKGLSIFFAVFLLFSSGFVYQVAKDRPSSISLSTTIEFPRFYEQELITGEWLKNGVNRTIPIYSDVHRGLMLVGMLGESYYFQGYDEITSQIPKNVYFFFGYLNVVEEEIPLISSTAVNMVPIQNLTLYTALSEDNRIYDNGGSNVYLTPDN